MTIQSKPVEIQDRVLNVFYTKLEAWCKKNKNRIFQKSIQFSPVLIAVRDLIFEGVNTFRVVTLVNHLISFIVEILDVDDKDMITFFMTRITSVYNLIRDQVMKFLLHMFMKGKKRPQPQRIQDPEDTRKHESDNKENENSNEIDITKIPKILIGVLTLILGFFDKTSTFTSRITNAVNNGVKNMRNFSELWKMIKEFLGLTKSEFAPIISIIDKQSNDAQKYISGSLSDNYESRRAMKELLKDMEKTKNDAAEIFKGNPREESLLKSFVQRRQALQQVFDATDRIAKNIDSVRPLPVCRHFFGPPGHGKTEFIERSLNKEVLEATGESLVNPVYTVPPAIKYFGDYVNQPIMLIDEFLDKNEESEIVPIFNSLASGGMIQIDGAAIEGKGQVPKHRFLFTISNKIMLEVGSNSNMKGAFQNAFNSRLNKVYVHWKDYDKGKSRTSQNDAEGDYAPRKLCFHLVPQGQNRPNYQQFVDDDNPDCPYDDDIISKDNLVNQIVKEYQKNNKDYKTRLSEAMERVKEHNMRARVPVLLLHGPTRSGKTSMIDKLMVYAKSKNMSVGGTIDQFITVLDDILPDDQDMFRETYDSKRKGFMIVAMNDDFKNLKFIRSTKMHSRIVARLPLRGRFHTGDRKIIHSDNPGMTCHVKHYNDVCVNNKRYGYDEAMEKMKDFIDSFEDVSEDIKFVDSFEDLPETSFLIKTDLDGKYKIEGVPPTELMSLELATKIAKEVGYITSPNTTDPFDALRTISYMVSARSPDAVLGVDVAGHANMRFVKGTWYICLPREVTEDEKLAILRGESLDCKIRESVIKETVIKTRDDIDTKLENYYSENLELFVSSNKGKILATFFGLMSAIAVSAATMTWLALRLKKKENKESAKPERRQHENAVEMLTEIIKDDDRANDLIDSFIAEHQSTRDPDKGRRKTTTDKNQRVKERVAYNNRIVQNYEQYHVNDTAPTMIGRSHHMRSTDGKAIDLMCEVLAGDHMTNVDSCQEKVMENIVAVSTKNGNTVYGIMFAMNYGISMAHILSDEDKEVIITKRDKRIKAKIVEVDFDSDRFFFQLPKEEEFCKAITKNFIKEAHIDGVTTGCFINISRRNGKEFITRDHGLVEIDFDANFTAKFQRMTKNFASIAFPGGGIVSTAGDCGLPYIATDVKGVDALVFALHSIHSQPEHKIWGTGVTQEYLNDFLRRQNILKTHQSGKMRNVKIGDNYVMARAEIADWFTEMDSLEGEIFEPNDRIKLLGFHSKLHTGYSKKFSYRELPHMHEERPGKIPAIMPNKDLPDETIGKLVKNPKGKPCRGFTQLKKMELNEKTFSKEFEEAFFPEYISYMKSWFPDSSWVRPLNNYEVINGVKDGPLSKVHGFDMSKSSGFTMKKLYGISTKNDLFDNNENGQYTFKKTEAVKTLFEMIEEVEANPEGNFFFPTTATLKDELLPAHKVINDGKIRIFSNVDFVELYLTKKYLGFAVGGMQNHMYETSFTAGLDALGGFHRMYQKLTKHPNLLTFDYSGWDKRLPRIAQVWFAKVMASVTADYYTEHQQRMAEWCMRRMIDRYEVFNGNLMEIKGSLPSGTYWTNFMNSGCNEILIFHSIYEAFKKKNGYYPSLQLVLNNIVLYTHGDDVIMSISDEFSKFIDYFRFKEHLASMGMPITPGNKEGAERAFEPLWETTFLSRYPIFKNGYLYGALKKESILQTLNYTKIMDDSLLEDLFTNNLVEASLWDEEFFLSVQETIRKNIKHKKIKMFLWPQETYHKKILTRLGMIQATPACLEGSREYPFSGSELSKDTPINIDKPIQNTLKHENSKMLSFKCKNCKEEIQNLKGLLQHLEVQSNHQGLIEGSLEGDNLETWLKEAAKTLDVSHHIIDVNDHKRDVSLVGEKLFGKKFESHDLSKFSLLETVGYTLRWFNRIEGTIWEHALQHHYDNNDHHPEFFTKKGEEVPTRVFSEMIADAVACKYGREFKYAKTPIECLGVLRKEIEDVHNARAQRYLPFHQRILQFIDDVLKKFSGEKTTQVIFRQGGAVEAICKTCRTKTSSAKALIRHVKNSHPKEPCPYCESEKGHSEGCEGMLSWKCRQCEYTNESETKCRNHQASAHKIYDTKPVAFDARTHHEKKDPPNYSLMEQEELNKLNPISIFLNFVSLLKDWPQHENGSGIATGDTGVITTSDSAPPTLLDAVQGLPTAAVFLPGFIDDVKQKCYDWIRCQTLEILSTTATGTQIWKKSYGTLVDENPFVAAYGLLHRYVTGSQEFRMTVYGASNFTGSIIFGILPAGGLNTPTIEQLQSYGNTVELSFSGQRTASIILRQSKDEMSPTISGNSGGNNNAQVVAIIKQQLQNSLGTGAATVSIQIDHRMGPDGMFTYADPSSISTFAQPQEENQCLLNSATLPLNQFTTNGIVPFPVVDGDRAIDPAEVHRYHQPIPKNDALKNELFDDDFGSSVPMNGGSYPQGSRFVYFGENGTARKSGVYADDFTTQANATNPDYAIDCDYNANLTLIDGENFESAEFVMRGGSSCVNCRVEANTTVEDEVKQRWFDYIQNNVVRHISAFNPRDLSRFQPLPSGIKRFCLSNEGLITINPEINQKLPLQGCTRSNDRLIRELQKIGKGRSLLFTMFSGQFPVANLKYDAPTREVLINTTMNYSYYDGDVYFSDFRSTSDSSVPPTTAPSTAWIGLETEDGFSLRTTIIKSEALKRESRVHHMLKAAAVQAGGQMGSSTIGVLGSGSHQRQRQRWLEEIAPSIAEYNQEMMGLNAHYSDQLNRRSTAYRTIGAGHLLTEANIQAAGLNVLDKNLTMRNFNNAMALTNANLSTQSTGVGLGQDHVVDSAGRYIQTTPGGNNFVQNWKRQPAVPKPKTFSDALQQTGWGENEVFRGERYEKGNAPTGVPENPSMGTSTDPPAPPPSSTGTMFTAQGSQTEGASDISTGPELSMDTAINTDGNITIIDDDMPRYSGTEPNQGTGGVGRESKA